MYKNSLGRCFHLIVILFRTVVELNPPPGKNFRKLQESRRCLKVGGWQPIQEWAMSFCGGESGVMAFRAKIFAIQFFEGETN